MILGTHIAMAFGHPITSIAAISDLVSVSATASREPSVLRKSTKQERLRYARERCNYTPTMTVDLPRCLRGMKLTQRLSWRVLRLRCRRGSRRSLHPRIDGMELPGIS